MDRDSHSTTNESSWDLESNKKSKWPDDIAIIKIFFLPWKLIEKYADLPVYCYHRKGLFITTTELWKSAMQGRNKTSKQKCLHTHRENGILRKRLTKKRQKQSNRWRIRLVYWKKEYWWWKWPHQLMFDTTTKEDPICMMLTKWGQAEHITPIIKF